MTKTLKKIRQKLNTKWTISASYAWWVDFAQMSRAGATVAWDLPRAPISPSL